MKQPGEYVSINLVGLNFQFGNGTNLYVDDAGMFPNKRVVLKI